jgi:hypothetical protein
VVGRLDNIIARNRRASRPSERVIGSFVIGFVVLLILALAVFTDLGVPPDAGRPRPPATPGTDRAPGPGGERGPERGKAVDGVLLRRSPATRPSAQPSGPSGAPR